MKRNGVLHKMNGDDLSLAESPVSFNNLHAVNSLGLPLTNYALKLTDEEKIRIISEHFSEIMNALGLDLQDDSLRDTPRRVAKMFVKEIFGGLDPVNKPSVTLFENTYGYKQMLLEKNISLYSTCEHHFVPIIGKVHIAYISAGKVAGLSKLNRIVQYYAQRPQVQERLTIQIADELNSVLGTEDVAVIIDAVHLCVASRGIRDVNSSTVTAEYRGAFAETEKQNELLRFLD